MPGRGHYPGGITKVSHITLKRGRKAPFEFYGNAIKSQIVCVESWINNISRECLGYGPPAEIATAVVS